MRAFILAALLIGLALQTVQAQDSEANEVYPEYANLIKLSPFSFGRSHFEVSYEHYFKDRSKSIVISPTFMLKESSFESFRGAKLELQFRVYLNNLNHRDYHTWFFDHIGYYAAPFVSGTIYQEDQRTFQYVEETQTEIEGEVVNDIQAGETGLLLGGQFHITPRFVLDLFAGGAIRYASTKTTVPTGFDERQYFYNEDTFDQGYTGIKPAGGFMIGFTF